MIKLSDMQLVLLATAAARDDGSLLPPAESLGVRMDRIRRSVGALVTKDLASEFIVTEINRSWREADGTFYGVMINDAGRALIDGEPAISDQSVTEPVPDVIEAIESVKADTPAAASDTLNGNSPSSLGNYGPKLVKILDMLVREQGASLQDIVEVTGWLPHSVRAALSGFRKNALEIERTKTEAGSVYRIIGGHQ